MINENYFENIDNNEKAYWLGFLYADGYIQKRNNKNVKLQICLSVKDETHLDKFILCIDGELSQKRYYGPYKTSGKQVHWYTRNKKIVNDLIKLGCTNKKSHTIRFPKLDSDDLNCAFLFGYYDGDGTSGYRNTSITTGSKLFLEDIKNIFNIKNVIYLANSKYETYRLGLGRELYERIIKYYDNGLKNHNFDNCPNMKEYKNMKKMSSYVIHQFKPQKIKNIQCKKISHQKNELIIEKEMLEKLLEEMPPKMIAEKFKVSIKTINKKIKKFNIKRTKYFRLVKFQISKEELEKLIQEKPYTEIAKMFGVSDKAITNRAKTLGIELQNRLGYWSKIKHNK